MLGHVANSWTLLNIYELVHLIGDSLIKLSIFFPFIVSVEGSHICTHMDKQMLVLNFFSLIVVIFLTNHLLFS